MFAAIRRPVNRLRHLGGPAVASTRYRTAARAFLAVLVLALGSAAAAIAVPATTRLVRQVVAGGGGRSRGGALMLQGVAGQAVTGSSAGPGLTLHHGFWPVAAGQSPAASATGPTPSPSTPTATGSPQSTATPTVTQTPAIGRWEVNTTDDSDDGACNSAHCSLREALYAAERHDGPDTIRFAIPASDLGCDGAGVCSIQPTTRLPELLDDETTIDGFTQTGASPNSAAFGAPIDAAMRVVLDGSALDSAYRYAPGLEVRGMGSVIRGLVIHDFYTGIDLVGASHARIEGDFVGTDAEGIAAPGNSCIGVSVAGLEGQAGSVQNTIGGTAPSARNLISGNGCNGVSLGPDGANTVQGNYIGTDRSGTAGLPNEAGGVRAFSSPGNRIGGPDPGQPNVIAFNRTAGVIVDASILPSDGNTIQRNIIHSNQGPGISLEAGANGGIAPPTIDSATLLRVSGTACPTCTVEVFSDIDGQGAGYEGFTNADAAGRWALDKPAGFSYGNLTATATDADGNTSAFSAPLAAAGASPTVTPSRVPTSATPGVLPTGTPSGTATAAAPTMAHLPWVARHAAP